MNIQQRIVQHAINLSRWVKNSGPRTFFIIASSVFVLFGVFVLKSPPLPKLAIETLPNIAVNVGIVAQTPFQITLDSYGVVKPRTQSDLSAQVGGMITEINTQFRSGGYFKSGELLLVIDPRDYEVALLVREAELADAQQLLLLEQARASQAEQDWQHLGKEGLPSDLVLRKPQLASAQARVQSAQASVERARLDLDRTRVKAPYAGRMLEQHVDLGQVVSNNTVLGKIYASDYMEVRLPLRNSDIAFIDLPDIASTYDAENLPKVQFYSSLSQQHWGGRVTRTESALDDASHQLYIVAQIDDPYGIVSSKGQPPKIGEYLTARITGRIIDEAITISNEAIYQNDFVYLVEEGLLKRRTITVLWRDDNQSLVGSGLEGGDVLILNRVGPLSEGYPAVINQEIDLQNISSEDDTRVTAPSKSP